MASKSKKAAPKRKSPAKPNSKATTPAKPRAKAPVKKPLAAAPPAPTPSECRRKRGLIDELRDQFTTPERQSDIRAELAGEAMSRTPILSHAELGRLDG